MLILLPNDHLIDNGMFDEFNMIVESGLDHSAFTDRSSCLIWSTYALTR